MIALDATPLRRTISSGIVPSDVLYVAECSPWGKLGYEAVRKVLPSVQPVYWSPGMPKPDLSGWRGDWIIAFKADLILPRTTLECAKKGAINFHPSPPRYRGLGGYWWALHNGDKDYGVTAHHMDEQIDHGTIVKTDSFPILPKETEASLKERAAIHSLMLLRETLDAIQSGKPLAPCGVEWEPHLYTSKELAQAQSAQAAVTRRALVALEVVHGGIVSLSDEKAGTPQTDRSAKLALG
jgi:phosphoribosylglycinamide formyltransferase-1